MTDVEKFSVRELITALARLEDELRSSGRTATDDSARDCWLEAREEAILDELRRRSSDIARCADLTAAEGGSGMRLAVATIPDPMP